MPRVDRDAWTDEALALVLIAGTLAEAKRAEAALDAAAVDYCLDAEDYVQGVGFPLIGAYTGLGFYVLETQASRARQVLEKARLGRSIVAIVLALAALLWAAPLAVNAQPSGKVYRIGVLEMVAAAANADNLDAFRQALRELGYAEGQHFVLEYRSADGHGERCLDLATELVRLSVDVLVTRGTPAALAAKHATTSIPIVMASSGDPMVAGIVRSFARPRGTITGFHTMAPPELGGQRLKLLKEVVPAAARVGILWNSGDILAPAIVRDTERAARAMGIRLASLELPRRRDAFDQMFETAMLDQVDALIAVEDYLTLRDRRQIVEFAAMSRLPAIYGLREFVDAGGLISYGTDRRDLFRRSAGYVDRILKGARPADLPVEAPVRFELAINLKTANALGLTIPPSLLQRADYLVR
jgi:putative ABC transport system substrate-binding protein